MLRILRNADLVWKPWKNGGGMMADVAVSPEGADFDRADWRVSIAKVERDGPFSMFPGMDRGMVLLAGARLELHVDTKAPLLVEMDGPAVGFPGDRPTRGVPIGGPVKNLNVMARRGVIHHRFTRCTAAGQILLQAAERGATVLYVATGSLERRDDPAVHLGAGDMLVMEDAQTFLSGTARLIEINLWRA